MRVEWERIEADVDYWGRRVGTRENPRPGYRLWVEIPGLDRVARRRVVAAVVDRLWGGDSDSPLQVLPTLHGTYGSVWRRDWRADVTALAEALVDYQGTITAPPAVPSHPPTVPFRSHAFMAFPMEPAASRYAFPEDGRIHPCWGLAAGLTAELLREGAAWASVAGPHGRVGHVPVVDQDAADVLEAVEQPPNASRGMFFSPDLDASGFRNLGLGTFSRVSWLDHMEGRSLLGDAIALVERLRTYATEVQYARIGLTSTYVIVDSDSRADDGWLRARGAWDEYVRLAYPIQVLTSSHLRRCTDLSGWDVEKIAPGRWLVTDKNLERWFNQPLKGLALTARGLTQLSRDAEAGFGDAIFPGRWLG